MSSRWPGPDMVEVKVEDHEDFLPGEAEDGELWWGGHEDEYDYTPHN